MIYGESMTDSMHPIANRLLASVSEIDEKVAAEILSSDGDLPLGEFMAILNKSANEKVRETAYAIAQLEARISALQDASGVTVLEVPEVNFHHDEDQ